MASQRDAVEIAELPGYVHLSGEPGLGRDSDHVRIDDPLVAD